MSVRSAGQLRRELQFVVALAVLCLGTGCATASAAWRSGPAGMAAERGIRSYLANDNASVAWSAMGDKKMAPADALLRHMYRSVIALHAGEFEAGTRSSDRAWTIADDRFTKSVSTGALSLMTADATLPYEPGPTERMFIPYYGGLNWLARGERTEAAVEARRLAALLESERADLVAPPMRGVLRYVSGAIFEAAGDRQDALVAYRNAAVLLGALPGDTTLASRDSGDVIVLIEDGFVGRPAPRSLGVYLDDGELAALSSGDDEGRLALAHVIERRSWQYRDGYHSETDVAWLTYEINWTAFERAEQATYASGVRVANCAVAEGATCEATTVVADVTTAIQADYEREQGARLTRAIVRTGLRYAAMRAAEHAFEKADEQRDKRKAEGKKGGGWGAIFTGIALSAGALTSAAIDQPDLRAWQVLPDRITIARMRLPVGEHVVEVTRAGEAVALGTVTVTPRGVTVLNHRWWP